MEITEADLDRAIEKVFKRKAKLVRKDKPEVMSDEEIDYWLRDPLDDLIFDPTIDIEIRDKILEVVREVVREHKDKYNALKDELLEKERIIYRYGSQIPKMRRNHKTGLLTDLQTRG